MVHNPRRITMSTPIVPETSNTLAKVTTLQTRVGLVKQVVLGRTRYDLLSSMELGRQAGLPGIWTQLSHHANLLAWKEKLHDLKVKSDGSHRWEVTAFGTGYMKCVNGRHHWIPRAIKRIKEAHTRHNLGELEKAFEGAKNEAR
jgi:hypothetical protein